jgi:hypothetical protein
MSVPTQVFVPFIVWRALINSLFVNLPRARFSRPLSFAIVKFLYGTRSGEFGCTVNV